MKKKPSAGKNKVLRRAYHEAGHAVAAYLLAIPFTSVDIVPTKDTFGQIVLVPVDWEAMTPADTAHLEARRVVMTLAGGAAEKQTPNDKISHKKHAQRMTGDLFHASVESAEVLSLGGFTPWTHVTGREGAAYQKAVKAYQRLAEVRAAVLVKRERRAIRALARELVKRQILSAEEAAAIIEANRSSQKGDSEITKDSNDGADPGTL